MNAVPPAPDALKADTRAGREIGRSARLDLRFAYRGGRTVLASSYAEPPFRIGKCLPTDDGVHLMIASSAPGIFGGDRFEQRVIVEAGAHVTLTSQSSLQAHPAPDGESSTMASEFVVAAGGSLTCEWHPLIPFAGADIAQRIGIELEDGAMLWWSDAVMSGREARGERWQFARLAHELRLTIGGRLRYLERYAIEPPTSPVSTAWMADESCYFGTVIEASPRVDRVSVDRCHEALQALAAVRSAADLLEPGLMLVRVMAASGVPFHAARQMVASHPT